jgi:hypothetical protein
MRIHKQQLDARFHRPSYIHTYTHTDENTATTTPFHARFHRYPISQRKQNQPIVIITGYGHGYGVSIYGYGYGYGSEFDRIGCKEGTCG